MSELKPFATRFPTWIRKPWARARGYFWLDCPMCGQPFGGNELGTYEGIAEQYSKDEDDLAPGVELEMLPDDGTEYQVPAHEVRMAAIRQGNIASLQGIPLLISSWVKRRMVCWSCARTIRHLREKMSRDDFKSFEGLIRGTFDK